MFAERSSGFHLHRHAAPGRLGVARRISKLGLAAVLAASLAAAGCTGSVQGLGATTGPPSSAPSTPSYSRSVSLATPTPTSGIVTDPMQASWTVAIDRVIGGRNVSVAVGVGTRIVFVHGATVLRMPASNEKLLTSMAALDAFGPSFRFRTSAEATTRPKGGVIDGNLWLVGSGDPELTDADLVELASALQAAGLLRVTGSVAGDTSAFTREWWAPGWLPGISREFVTRPTALALNGNEGAGPPELAAADSLTRALRRTGVRVDGDPKLGVAPAGLKTITSVRSATLDQILSRQNHGSINFDAEMITKALGADANGEPGSTATGAEAIQAWAAARGVRAQVRDGSGLSHLDRSSTAGIVTLLLQAGSRPWGDVLFNSLPAPGQGTLDGRLSGVPVRAKTGTLFITPASALSGYVRSADGRLVAFSVLSRGLDKTTAIQIEDSIVRILAAAQTG